MNQPDWRRDFDYSDEPSQMMSKKLYTDPYRSSLDRPKQMIHCPKNHRCKVSENAESVPNLNSRQPLNVPVKALSFPPPVQVFFRGERDPKDEANDAFVESFQDLYEGSTRNHAQDNDQDHPSPQCSKSSSFFECKEMEQVPSEGTTRNQPQDYDHDNLLTQSSNAKSLSNYKENVRSEVDPSPAFYYDFINGERVKVIVHTEPNGKITQYYETKVNNELQKIVISSRMNIHHANRSHKTDYKEDDKDDDSVHLEDAGYCIPCLIGSIVMADHLFGEICAEQFGESLLMCWGMSFSCQ